ncbi:hypothetical protein ABBQ32_005597 [Trebouxia sp. C0010 RCD-2024]
MFHRNLHHKVAALRSGNRSTTLGMLAIGSVETALKRAGAEDDLHTILQVLEDISVGFKRREAAPGPLMSMDITMLTGLNIRMLSAIKRMQQQQQQQQHQGSNHLLEEATRKATVDAVEIDNHQYQRHGCQVDGKLRHRYSIF